MELPSAWSGSNLMARPAVVSTRMVCAGAAFPSRAIATRNSMGKPLRPFTHREAIVSFLISECTPGCGKRWASDRTTNAWQRSSIISFQSRRIAILVRHSPSFSAAPGCPGHTARAARNCSPDTNMLGFLLQEIARPSATQAPATRTFSSVRLRKTRSPVGKSLWERASQGEAAASRLHAK